MASSPAFQFYPDDFLGSSKVAVMSAEEVGIYLLLLCWDWNENGIEWVPEDLARFCRTTDAAFGIAWEKRLRRCFVERDGRFWNPRLEREREKQAKFRAKQSAAGTASAQARFNRGSTVVQPDTQPAGNSPFPSPFPAQATAFRASARKTNGNGDHPIRPHAPAVLVTPPWCVECGPGELRDVEGQKRPQRFHLSTCSQRTA